jgi:DNA-binding GntR family transcriptional regulator
MATRVPDTHLPRKSLPQAVAHAIREEILLGRIPMAARLNQDALAARFGVSRIPVREALRQLEAEGLVEIHPHRGAFVASLAVEDIKGIYEIRIALESLALEFAAPQARENDLETLEALLSRMDAEVDPAHWLDLNLEFHGSLYAPSGRTHLCHLIETLRRHSEPYLRIYVAPMGRIRMAQEEHHQIFEAYRRRDATAAAAALRIHLNHTLHGLLSVLPRGGGSPAAATD